MIGYAIQYHPGPIGIFAPTDGAIKKFSKRKLNQMLRDTPSLKQLVADPGKRKGDNSIQEKEFPGGFLSLAGLKTVNNVASQSFRDVYVDEADRVPFEVGDEGDVFSLLRMRQENFDNSKFVIISTPTIKGMSRIEESYNLSDKRKPHVPCPHCKKYQILIFGGKDYDYGLKWDEGDPSSAYYLCQHCGKKIYDYQKYNMVSRVKWVKEKPEVTDHAGFWINSLYSTRPKAAWPLIVKEFLDAKDN